MDSDVGERVGERVGGRLSMRTAVDSKCMLQFHLLELEK